jgi:hypothetical protein
MRSLPSQAKWGGIFLFAFGAGVGLFLTGAMTWAEIESSLASTPADSKSLDLSCPLMLAHNENGFIRTEIVNETDKEVKPVVIASFGQSNSLSRRQVTETYILPPREKQALQWKVDVSDAAFEKIIPVAVIQSRYNINPPRWGTCGILLFNLFGMNGVKTLSLIIFTSILSMICGAVLSRPFFSASDSPKPFAQMGLTLAGLIVLAMASSIFRLWGLTALIDILSLILIGTLVTEIIVPHRVSG